MARNSRLNVCLATTTRNSSKIHWQRSTIRQRTTPCTAGIGPLSSIAASAARCAPFRRDGCPGWSAINQPFRPMGVELHHPIANDLERHPADLRRLGPARAVVNRRQRQKPPGLRPILRPPRGSPHHPRIEKISPKWNGHGEPPALATLNCTHADLVIPPSELPPSFGISPSTLSGHCGLRRWTYFPLSVADLVDARSRSGVPRRC